VFQEFQHFKINSISQAKGFTIWESPDDGDGTDVGNGDIF
jgi:hypothetical protein